MSLTGATASQSATEVWTIERILRWTQDYFAQKGIATARLDAEVLLAHALNVGRVRLYTHYDQPLSGPERDAFRALVRRRAASEPVAYIVGTREFYGRDFAVGSDVLIPRPETEHVVEEALAWLQTQSLPAPRVADVGTGSGALAVTLALEVPAAQVTAVDVSEAALTVAQGNAERLGAAVQFACSDLLAAAPGPFDVIVSNPPYVTTGERAGLSRDVRDYEPALALFAGPDGLEVIRRLIPQAAQALAPGGLFLCEFGCTQAAAVQGLMPATSWQDVRVVADLQGHPRVLRAVRSGG